jgi:hypothetical protein
MAIKIHGTPAKSPLALFFKEGNSSPVRDCLAMREKGSHSGKSRNPGILKKNKLSEITRYLSMAGPTWMPACAGMTNYDTVSRGGWG